MPVKNDRLLRYAVGPHGTYLVPDNRFGVIQTEYMKEAIKGGKSFGEAEAPFIDAVGYTRYGKTNLSLWSEDFSNAVWVKQNPAALSLQIEELDGSSVFLYDADNSNSFLYQVVEATKENMTFSIWLKGDSAFSLEISFLRVSPFEKEEFAVCNVTTDWQKFTVTIPDAIIGVSYQIAIGGFNTFSTGENLYLSKAQLNEGATALPYVKTTDEQVVENIFNAGTNDAVRGADSGEASDDPGIISQGLSFDGAGQYYNAPALLDEDFTVIVAVKPGGIPTISRIFESRLNSANVNGDLVLLSSGLARFTVINSADGTKNTNSTSVLSNGTTYMLAAKRDGTTASIYVDGVNEATSTGINGAISSHTSTTVGARSSLVGFFEGEMYAFMILKVALTDAEVGYMRTALQNLGIV